ncbi:MAG TPA: peptidoglycan editing factor PgeF [Methylophilaceae bacterium]|nr:peptidoglycan editing factor PgeF [Methylophilaceae bacterium]
MNKLLQDSFIVPDWPCHANVHALQTTRAGGFSQLPFDSLNLADHVEDNPLDVAKNRQLLASYVPTEPLWLNQVHGVHVIDAAASSCQESADASYTTIPNVVCVTMTADCLPVLISDKAGTIVAAVHAGWRSLCDGIIEATVEKMQVPGSNLMAWLGPAIGPESFEVSEDVRNQFIAKDKQAITAFKPSGEKWLGDLYSIARQRLHNLGLKEIYGKVECTFTNENRFFSFRRDGKTGRMATMIWLSA